MFIRPPRNNDDYRDRDLDCQEAIEREFLQAVHSSGTAFVDLAKIRTAISEHAVPLGWSAEELEAAMLELVRCYMLRVQQVRNADLSASSPARH